jgi:biotin-dependent carboxylase-like uncharacterized protein
MIEILSSAQLATVQDLGRTGYLRYGVGIAGAMDPVALSVGNRLLGNSADCAGIEVPVFPFRLRFGCDLGFALTGADSLAQIDGRGIPPWWSQRGREGQVLTLNPPSSGARAYLTLAGGIDVPLVLGSRSTQLRGAFGGYQGRALRKGDIVHACRADESMRATVLLDDAGMGVQPPGLVLGSCSKDDAGRMGATTVRVLCAGEYERFEASSLERFWNEEWKITGQSNRSGYRLAGPSLKLGAPLEKRSHGIVPGVIQVPSGGQPIVQMQDAQTMGGYPKIGTVIEADLWKLAQARTGSGVRFAPASYAEAVSAFEDVERYLDQVGRDIEACLPQRRKRKAGQP